MAQDSDPAALDAETPEEETLFVYDTDYEVGQDNVEIAGLDVHNPVFFLSSGLIILFAAISLIFPDAATHYLTAAKTWTLQSADWLFAVTPVIIFVFVLYLAISPLGKIRLGGPTAQPEFRTHSWVAMLFAAGVGVGFMFYGAAEPLAYYTDWYGTPLNAEAGTPAAERLAFSATIFHWGLAPLGHLCDRRPRARLLCPQQGSAAQYPVGLLPCVRRAGLGLAGPYH